jgi:hypothetical protein
MIYLLHFFTCRYVQMEVRGSQQREDPQIMVHWNKFCVLPLLSFMVLRYVLVLLFIFIYDLFMIHFI